MMMRRYAALAASDPAWVPALDDGNTKSQRLYPTWTHSQALNLSRPPQ
jgi:hypothetical protein